jgi:hypothetical protein
MRLPTVSGLSVEGIYSYYVQKLLYFAHFCFNEIGQYSRVLVIQASVNNCYFELKAELCLDSSKKNLINCLNITPDNVDSLITLQNTSIYGNRAGIFLSTRLLRVVETTAEN